MSWIIDLVTNYYFLSFFVAWLSACLIKSVVRSVKNKEGFKIKYGFQNGGMPSTHSAAVVSIVTAIGYFDMVSVNEFSVVFYVSLVFALVVISDAFGVRQYVGEQGEALNKLLKENHKDALKVVHGHTFYQVIAGSIWGIIVAIVMFHVLI